MGEKKLFSDTSSALFRCALIVVLSVFLVLSLICLVYRSTAEEYFPSESYTLREYDGKIGVFRQGNVIPDRVLDVYVFMLPENDAIRLEKGICVTGSDAVRSLIEDFTG